MARVAEPLPEAAEPVVEEPELAGVMAAPALVAVVAQVVIVAMAAAAGSLGAGPVVLRPGLAEAAVVAAAAAILIRIHAPASQREQSVGIHLAQVVVVLVFLGAEQPVERVVTALLG